MNGFVVAVIGLYGKVEGQKILDSISLNYERKVEDNILKSVYSDLKTYNRHMILGSNPDKLRRKAMLAQKTSRKRRGKSRCKKR